MKKEKLILIVCLVILFLFVSIVIFVKLNNSNSNNNDIFENKNKDVVSDKEVSNILFSNIKYKYDGTGTEVSMKITNKNDKIVKIGEMNIKIFDESKVFIGEFNPFVIYDLYPDRSGEITFSIEKNLSEAFSLEIELPNLEFIDINNYGVVE